MKYTPKSIKRTLKKCITKISATPETYAKNPGRDFTRTRKLPFETVLKSVLSMTGKSLRGELMDLFGLKLDTPTVSAFLQQRDKVNFQAFEDLFGRGCQRGGWRASQSGADPHRDDPARDRGAWLLLRRACRDGNRLGHSRRSLRCVCHQAHRCSPLLITFEKDIDKIFTM